MKTPNSRPGIPPHPLAPATTAPTLHATQRPRPPGRRRSARPRPVRAMVPALLAPLVLTAQTCEPIDEDASPTPPAQPPTMDTCKQWIEDAAGAQDLPAPECAGDWAFFRDLLETEGGATFPVGDGRYFLLWFPEGWGAGDDTLVVSLHGTGGCAEWMMNWWYQTAGESGRGYAIAALQYYTRSSETYDDDEVIYQNLQDMIARIRSHCPLETVDIVYHGFSRGSAQSFPIAVRDRAADQIFAAFIADSGTSSLSYDTLETAADDALTGARFWMWCGAFDCSTVEPTTTTCDRMETTMAPYVTGHGGTVDAIVSDPDGCHGIFNECSHGTLQCPDLDCEDDGGPSCNCYDCNNRTADNLGDSLPLLFDYIDAL